MTSTNDGKDVKSNQTSGQKSKTYYIELYKSLEAQLSAECSGEQRTRLVCEAWRRVHSLCQHSAPSTHLHLLAWLQRHTSHIILQTEWQSPKSKEQHIWLEEAIDVYISECQAAISTRNGVSPSWESQLLHRAQWFKRILSKPWDHPVLKALLDSRGIQPTDQEVLAWLKEERGVMFVTRLRQLAASKCDDLALLLAAAVMARARTCAPADAAAEPRDQTETARNAPTFVDILRNEAGFTVDVWELLTDIEFVLLHKGESRSRCIELAKQTPLRNGYQLVERLRSRLEMSPRDKKMWKNAKEVATLIAQVVIARCMVVPVCAGAARLALHGCASSLVKLLPPDKLPTAAAALAAPAATSRHLHTLAYAIHTQCKNERKSFVCELYVRAITAGMNELERLKLKTEKESEAHLTEEILSNWFTQLGSLLSTSSRLNCECVLTAFSVHPSSSMYETVKAAPPLAPILKDIQEPGPDTNSEFGSWATDSRTQTNLVKTSETINLKQTQKQANVLSTAIFAEGEALGLGAELCQDLAVLISGPRVKTLSWDMDREALLENCRMYMERTHGGTRALTTELKYLNLDPRSFQHLPEELDDENDAFYGIEKGYEHLVELQEPEEMVSETWEDALSDDLSETESAHSLEELPIVIPRRKKKSKRLKLSNYDEIDPLSLEGETETSEKKERPHSKERSKERKDKIKIKEASSNNISLSTEYGQLPIEKIKDIRKKEKKKEKKERRKKEKTDKLLFEAKQQNPPTGSLSRLVGMKVARIPEINEQLKNNTDTNVNNNLCITDSDYDSQGKSSITSINSEGNDPDVLFDGLFSMDEIKSPEKSSDYAHRSIMHKVEELRVAKGVVLNNTLGVPKIRQTTTQQQQINLQSMTPNIKPDFPCNVESSEASEEVKKSIKKLIQFRRHKSITNEVSPKMSNIHQTLMQDNIPTSDNIITSNSLNMYVNKEVQDFNALKDDINGILKNCNNKGQAQELTHANEYNKKNINVNSNSIYNKTHEKVINRNSAPICGTLVKSYQPLVNKINGNPSDLQLEKSFKSNLIKSTETPSQIQYKEFLKQRNLNAVKTRPIVTNVTDTPIQKQLSNTSKKQLSKQVCKPREKIGTTNLPIIANVQRNFSKEPTRHLSEPLHINTDNLNNPLESSMHPPNGSPNIADGKESPTQNHFESFLKELQETINAGASKEKRNDKLLSYKTSYPKQRKGDKAPNTFSRLSYLHKNKHNDNKHKIVANQTKLIKHKIQEDKQNFSLNLDTLSNLKSKGEIHVSRIDKPRSISNDNTKRIVSKSHNFKCSPSIKNAPLCLNKQYPVISNMLSSNSPCYGSKILNDFDNKNSEPKIFASPTALKKGNLTENDQKDLLLLLRQQSKMHPLQLKHKTDEVQNNSVNCATTINKNIQPSVKSNYKDSRPKDSHIENRNVPILEKSNSTASSPSSVKVSNNKSTNASDLKKVRNVKGKGSSSKQALKTNDTQTSDWESVMNALRAQKTPSRGPNALDIVLKKDSIEEIYSRNVENHNIKATGQPSNSSKTVIDYTNLKQCPIKSNSTLPSSAKTGQIDMTVSPNLKQKQYKKLNSQHNNVDLAMNSPLDFNEKHLPDVIQNTNDPFISGIPNSDYDLLEELMDDDLRKEIGELMSDEEAYTALTQCPKIRNANSFVNKYPNHKTDTASIRKSQNVEPCQNLYLPNNKDVIFPPTPMKDLQSTFHNQNSTPVDNPHKKPRIISNELITSTAISQPNLKICNNNPVNDFFTTERNNLNSCNKNVGNNVLATSACNKPKRKEVLVKDIQNNDTDNSSNSQNQTIDPTRVILTVPQRSATPKMVLIGSDLIYKPYSTIQVDHTNNTKNAYGPVNKTSNLTLFTTQSVNPVIIDRSITLPIIRRVSPNVLLNLNSNNSEIENCTLNSHLEKTLNIEEAKSTCNNMKGEKISHKECDDNKCSVNIDENPCDFVHNISTLNNKSPNNKDAVNSMHTNCYIEKDDNKELMQILQQDTTRNMNHDLKETEKASKEEKKIGTKIPLERKENKSLLITKQIDHEINNPINCHKEEDKKDEEREDCKQKVLLNKHLSHSCYDKPIHNTHAKSDESYVELNMDVAKQSKTNDTLENSCSKTLENIDETNCNNSLQPLTKNAIDGNKSKNNLKCQNLNKKQNPLTKPDINKYEKNKISKNLKQTTLSSLENQIKPKSKGQENDMSTFETNMKSVVNKNEILAKSNDTCVDIEERITTAIIPNVLNEMNKKHTENITLKENKTESNPNYPLMENSNDKHNSSSERKNSLDDVNNEDVTITNSEEHETSTSTVEKSLVIKEVKDGDVNGSHMNDADAYISDLTKHGSSKSAQQNQDTSSVIENKITYVNDNSDNRDQITSKSNLDVPNQLSNEHCRETQLKVLDKELGKKNNENISEYKDKVVFEEIPSHNNNDPLKKCIRIKLPNGNTFKATISGKLNVNIDSIFEDPMIKKLLWKNINNNTKCTLNIKQVAIRKTHKSHTGNTNIHDISYVMKPIVCTSTETINLVSDDEDSTQTFKTEFGNFDVAIMNTDVFEKHRKRFSQKCVVEIERLPIELKALNESSKQLKSKTLEITDTLTCNADSSLSTSLDETITDFIEIDDSSNESELNNIVSDTHANATNLTENDDDIKKMVLQDFDVAYNETEYTTKNAYGEEVCQSVENLSDEFSTVSKTEKIKSKECLLKIEKCDKLIKKMEIRKKVCFVSLVRCDENLKCLRKKKDLFSNIKCDKKLEFSQDSLIEDSSIDLEEHFYEESTLKRSGSLSLLNDFKLTNESKIQKLPFGENNNFFKDSLLINEPKFVNQSPGLRRKCNADWCMTKFDIHYCYNDSGDTLVGNNSKTENDNLKYEDVSTDCDSDVDTSTSLIVPAVKENNTCSSNPIVYKVPTLVKLTVNYFVNNSKVIQSLKPYVCFTHLTSKPANLSPLKRKTTDIVDKVNRHKISKIENVFEKTDINISLKTNDNTQATTHTNPKSLDEFVEDSLKSQNNQELNNWEFENFTKTNNDKIFGDRNPKTKSEVVESPFENLSNGPRSSNNENIANTFFQKQQHELIDRKTNNNKLGLSNIETKPASVFVHVNCDSKKSLENRNDYTDCLNCDDKVEVIIPLEEIDDESIQSLPTDSEDSANTHIKTLEIMSNKLEVQNKQILLNTIVESQPNCAEKFDFYPKNDETFDGCDKELKNENVNIKEEKTIMMSDLTSQNDSSVNDSNSADDNTAQQNVTLVYKGDSRVVLKGSIYEDPVIGTCYVFPIINKASYSDQMDCNNICDENTINVIQAIKNNVFDDQLMASDENENSNNFNVVIPKITYSRQRFKQTEDAEKLNRKNLKRKIDMFDVKLNEKRYRKSKNIDYPKITVTAMSDSAYSKEYKRLFNYCSSIKFSFSRPFHKEYIDVPNALKCWPIKEPNFTISDKSDYKNVLFSDENTNNNTPYDPLQQTLAEEIASKYEEQQSSCDQISENNFNMGFGEGSGRVIKITEDGDNISKFSAATLSDVKQSQPFLLSEDYDDHIKCRHICNSNKDQFEIVKRYVSYVQLREKVRSFFRKTTSELNYQWLKDNVKDSYKRSDYMSQNANVFPYDLISTDFIEPAPVETVVQVVQVGQLPVSTAAQNPVTCDPRVTQVTNASPSQCSVENNPHDDTQITIKTEYTELTTADLSLPLVPEYERHLKSQESLKAPICNENIPVEMVITSEIKIEEIKDEPVDYDDNDNLQSLVHQHISNVDYSYDSNDNATSLPPSNTIFESLPKNNSDLIDQIKQEDDSDEKTVEINHAMNAASIITKSHLVTNEKTNIVDNDMSQKMQPLTPVVPPNDYSKSSINAMVLQQALAQVLPPPLNQTNTQDNIQATPNSTATSQLHTVQGKSTNTNDNQTTLGDSAQNSVINNSNASVLHIVQNKGANNNSTTNANNGQNTSSYGGLSLVDAGLHQGNNQLLHIVNTSNQKTPGTGQLLKRVNLLTNLTNMQGSNEQKMVQFLCKAADGKPIQLNNSHQRSMVLRLQPIESSNNLVNNKPEGQDLSSSSNTKIVTSNKETINAQHEIKSRSVYEENYAKFIQNSSNKSVPEKSTSLPKFNQAFGKQVFQDNNQKTNDINSNTSHLTSVDINTESSECQPSDNPLNLDHIGQMNSPPLLLRKPSSQTTSTQPNLVQQIKQTITPMNIQTMHGGVIYTRQIPVNIGGGQTINLITVPSTDFCDDQNQKQHNDKFINQNDMETPTIKMVPQNQTSNSAVTSDERVNKSSSESSQTTQSQHQPVLTQMRIKLPMLSKAPQMMSGTRLVRPSFFQIQRNVIGGANQPVYQQLVLTAAPRLGQHTIRLPQAQTTRHIKVTSENQSSPESQMSSSTLEQLREFDMVLEQVKERSTVQPNVNPNSSYTTMNTQSSETTENTSITSTVTESTQQVVYSIGSNQSVNVAYVSRKPNATTTTQSVFVRSPDSSGISESPSSSTAQVQIPHTVTRESTSSEGTSQPVQQKTTKVSSKSKSRPKSSNPANSVKVNTTPPKTSTQKPLEDEQTTQRILYILAEYKEQVENSPDKDKPAPRRRTNPPLNPTGSSKRKKSSSSSRRPGARDISPVNGDENCRTMGSEDSSCGTSQGDCNENCLESNSPQSSPRKVVRKLSFENEAPRPKPQPQRNVIVADGQTITVARGTAGKPTTAVLMPANYILPVSMVKGGQQIAIVTNRGPKLLTVGGDGVTTNALLLQRLIGPAGLKPVLTRPGVRHVRLPTAALHNLQAFNLATATTVHPPDSTASANTPPELIETRARNSSWTDRESQDIKPERGSSPEGSEPWNLSSSADRNDYSYEETVRTGNMDRTVLDAIPDRYSPEMEAQRIFDKMFDVDSKKSYIVDSQDDSSRCAYDIDASDSDDKAYHQVVQRKDGGTHRHHHRLTHVSAAALRHKYAILEHELRLQGTAFLQKSLSEECEDLGVDSPSASELFPEAELLFGGSPAHDVQQHSHTPQPTILNQNYIPQPDIDDQIASDRLIRHEPIDDQQDLGVTLGLDEGIVTVSDDGMQATFALDQEEFARSHPNTTFHSEPTDEGEVQPFTITGLKGRHITSTIFHAGRAPATVLVTAPQSTVISQAAPEHVLHNVKYTNINHIINSAPMTHRNVNVGSVLVKDDGLTRFDGILTDSRELHLSNTASAIVHSTGNATQVIRRVCYEDDKRDTRYIMDEPDALIAGDDAKMIAEDSSRDATLESIAGDVDDDNSLPERHAELFWESNSASERSDGRRPLDFSSDSEKCCKSPSYDETNSTDSSGVGPHMRLDSVIKDARGLERSGSADGSSADDMQPPLRTYPPKRMYHNVDGEMERSMSGKTRAGFQEEKSDSLEIRRRASVRGVVKRGCPCCNGSPAPPRPKKPRQRKPTMDFTN